MQKSFVTIAALALSSSALLTSPAQARVCQLSFCVESTDTKRHVRVELWNQQNHGRTHFNVQYNGRQFETRGTFNLDSYRKNRIYRFSIQACTRGGLFSTSQCTPWVKFRHEAS